MVIDDTAMDAFIRGRGVFSMCHIFYRRNLRIWNIVFIYKVIPNESIYCKECEYAIIFGVTPLRGKLSGKVM